MTFDPYTLVIALGPEGNASGALYVDYGHSYSYITGSFQLRSFAMTRTAREGAPPADNSWWSGPSYRYRLQSWGLGADSGGSCPSSYASAAQIERILVLGLPQRLKTVRVSYLAESSVVSGNDDRRRVVSGPTDLTFAQSTTAASVVTIRKPDIPVLSDFRIDFE